MSNADHTRIHLLTAEELLEYVIEHSSSITDNKHRQTLVRNRILRLQALTKRSLDLLKLLEEESND